LLTVTNTVTQSVQESEPVNGWELALTYEILPTGASIPQANDAYSPYSTNLFNFPYFHSIYVFWLNLCFLLPPYFDQEARMSPYFDQEERMSIYLSIKFI